MPTRKQRRILLGRKRELGQPVAELARRGLAGRDRRGPMLEVGCREISQFRSDQDVIGAQQGERFFLVLLDQYVDDAARDPNESAQVLGLDHRGLQVDHDGHVGAHAARDVQRQVVGQSAIDEQTPVDPGRGQRQGHRQAGAQHL